MKLNFLFKPNLSSGRRYSTSTTGSDSKTQWEPSFVIERKNNPQKYFPNWAAWGKACQGWNPSCWLLALSFVEPHGGGALWGLLGFLWFWILHMLVGSREGSPRASESRSLLRLVISPTVCSGMINEQVLMCGSDSPVAPGQADIHRGAQTAGRPSEKQPH